MKERKNIYVLAKTLFNNLNNYKNLVIQKTEIEQLIKEKILNSKNRSDITCQKLSFSYFNEKGKYVCKSVNS